MLQIFYSYWITKWKNMQNKLSCIYLIRSKIDNKKYIGLTNNFHYRHLSHKRKLENNIHENNYIQRYYNKYTTGKFESVFEIFPIEEITGKKNLINRERYYIKLLETYNRNKGFNLTLGGEYGSVSNDRKKLIQRKKAKNVFVYNLDGEFIGEFQSVPDVAEILNLNKNSVMNALQRGIRLKNYLFYRTVKNFKKYFKGRTHSRRIYVFDTNFNQIDNIEYMTDCANKYNISINSINTCCNRLSCYNKNYYFVRDIQLTNFNQKYNLT